MTFATNVCLQSFPYSTRTKVEPVSPKILNETQFNVSFFSYLHIYVLKLCFKFQNKTTKVIEIFLVKQILDISLTKFVLKTFTGDSLLLLVKIYAVGFLWHPFNKWN